MGMRGRWLLVLVGALHLGTAEVDAQSITAPRLAILLAEGRRAASTEDLAALRNGLRSRDEEIVRLAVRALGRLERPSLVSTLLPALDHREPTVRAEAANALAQALGGPPRDGSSRASAKSLIEALAAKLDNDPDADVRASLAETIGRLVYADADSAGLAVRALLDLATSPDAELVDRLSAAKGLEAYVRKNRDYPLSDDALDLLRSFVRGMRPSANGDAVSPAPDPSTSDTFSHRGGRVRRLALDALVAVDAVDVETLERALADADPQVRRLAMRGARRPEHRGHLMRGVLDPSPIVRIEALRSLSVAAGREACQPAAVATSDVDPHVAIEAIDRLHDCGESPDSVERLSALAGRTVSAGSPAGWQHVAHALVALAATAPDRARPLLARHGASDHAALRRYVARAATFTADRALLERLAADADDNVVEAAVDALSTVAGRDATAVFVSVLSRRGYQAIRAAARALKGVEPRHQTVTALRAALSRLTDENQPNSLDVRAALTETLVALASPPEPTEKPQPTSSAPMSLDELRRLASPRARVTIRGVGTFDLALITQEAPATVVQFARLVEAGYYRGLTFHRIVPNFVIQGGSPGANEHVGYREHMRDEVGRWPHVRGAVGISTRGRDTGDAQFFIDLVDNPRLDHEYTVFAYVVAGMGVVDRILEGDVIEKIEMLDLRQ